MEAWLGDTRDEQQFHAGTASCGELLRLPFRLGAKAKSSRRDVAPTIAGAVNLHGNEDC